MMKHAEKKKGDRGKGTPISRAVSIFLFFFLVLFGGTVLIVVTWAIEKEFEEYNRENQHHDMVFIGEQIKSFLDDRILILQDYARFPIITQAVMQPESSKGYISDFMDNLLIQGRSCQIVLLDFEGQTIHRTSTAPIYDYRDAEWLAEIMQNKNPRHTMISRLGEDSYWRLAVPVYYSREIEGILVAEIPLLELNTALHLTASLQNAQLQLYQNSIQLASFGKHISSSSSRLFLPRLDLWLHYGNDYHYLEAVQKKLMISIAAILLGSAMAIILIASFLGRKTFVRPLEQLRVMTAALARGSSEIPSPARSKIREIRLLGHDFDIMAQTIRDREKDLRAIQETLEARVVDRTVDLEESHERIAAILRTIQSGIMVVDTETHQIIETNEACVSMIGIPREEIIGQSCGRFTKCGKNAQCPHRKPLAFLENEEDVLIAADGREITVLKTIVPITFNGRERILESFVNITQRKEAEKALAEIRLQEVRLAAHIQETLLIGPPPPEQESLDIAAITIPSQTVDGDFYDFHQWYAKQACLDLIIGDVMGKGVSAALLGAGAKTVWLQSLVSLLEQGGGAGIPATHEIMEQVHHRMVPELITVESFITLCYARFDIEKRHLEYVHCGHTEIIHWKAAQKCCQLLSGDNPPLGMLETDSYQTICVPFETGDCFVFYSDGITESENESGELYGTERLSEFIAKSHHSTAGEMMRKIQQEIFLFSKRIQHSDDISCIIVKAL